MIITLFFGLIGITIAAAVAGLVLMLIAPFTADRKPDFAEAFKAMFIAYLCQFFAGILVALVMINADEATTQVVGAIVGFLVLTVVLCYTIEATIPRGALTALVLIALGVLFRIALVALAASLAGDDTSSSLLLPATDSLFHHLA